jgi:alanine racemase
MRGSSKNSQAKVKERVFLEIDLGRIEKNYKALKEKAKKDVEVMCIVKADAYGHGMKEVSKRLFHGGCNFFGVSSVEEGVELRKSGIGGRVFVLGGISNEVEAHSLVKYDLTPVVHEIEGLRILISFVKKKRRSLGIHLKFDTGMGRLGFMPNDVKDLFEILKKEKEIHIEGIMSHFSESEKRNAYGLKQVENFKGIIGFFSSKKINPPYIHMANTGGLINYPEAYFNMVRIGIGLYGSYPSKELQGSLNIEEAMCLKSRITHVKEFEKGSFLSYGRTFRTKRRTRIGFIPCGYAYGYRRGLSNRASVIVRGKRCNVVGRICMDWTLIDITDTEAERGDEVILLGKKGNERITSWDLAEKLNTIPYEIFCGISMAVRRYYL